MGLDFVINDILNIVLAGTNKYYLITATSLYLDTAYLVNSTPGSTIKLFEGPTVSSNGTPMNIVGQNRALGLTTTGSAYADPTITTEGTLLYAEQIGTATVGGSGGQHSRSEMDELNFKFNVNTSYLFKITTLANNTDIFCSFRWAELPY